MVEAELIIKVPFHDIDPLEIVWHGNYIKYFEMVRAELLDKIDYNYEAMRQSGFAWPIIEVKLRYIKPATYGQKIKVHAILSEHEYRLKINYVITDLESGARLTKGHTIQVAVDMKKEELCLASPDVFLEKLGLK
ncbi:FIG002571: 4-hydroxybenzoyl-CoA thioesterase domain protein [hydrothermal vent metagenome]|uniref:FIG002571: 4-hydroxybenzoyl-CoA thioesterase domain protein n=1 Tax=hydrothermal vent metagenome TaxID=652676 RepID=A0A3B0WR76_9ZZZZ